MLNIIILVAILDWQALLIKKKNNTDNNVIIRKDTNKNKFVYHLQLIEFFKKSE